MISHLTSGTLRPFDILLFLLVLCTTQSVAQNSSPTQEDLLTEFQAASKRQEEIFKNFGGECRYHITKTYPTGTVKALEHKFTFALSGKSGMIGQSTDPDGQGQPRLRKNGTERDHEGIIVYNRDYSMTLGRKKPQSDFYVKWIENDPAVSQKLFDQGPRRVLRSPYSAGELTISQLFALKGFRVAKVTSMGDTPQARRVRIDFTIAKPPTATVGKNVYRTVAGWLIVVPSIQWAIQEYGVTMLTPASKKMTCISVIDYDRDNFGTLKPLLIRKMDYNVELTRSPDSSEDSAKPTVVEEFHFTKFRLGETPERDFTLTGFGLPEYGQTVKQAVASRTYPWWILGVAIGLALLALWLRRLASRTARKSSNSQSAI